MRVNLIAQAAHRFPPELNSVPIPVTLMIRPARGFPGEYTYTTDSRKLLDLLKWETDLPATVLDRFKTELRFAPSVRLLAVELSEQALTDMGFFI